jgi:hypothetical protein
MDIKSNFTIENDKINLHRVDTDPSQVPDPTLASAPSTINLQREMLKEALGQYGVKSLERSMKRTEVKK